MKDRIAFARALRREQTPAERAFWALLYPWRERGMHWRRQAPIGSYVVDFVCKSRKLVVEIDGDSHFSEAGVWRDAVRTAYLRQHGFTVLRFTNVDVLGYASVICGMHLQKKSVIAVLTNVSSLTIHISLFTRFELGLLSSVGRLARRFRYW